ncbi:hypothetical protein AMK27_17320 [Streptomyces sp. CB02009]|uniref:hypothetical protein n=1 Tax=Streptomyces sp. CB02009 TaxID=1703938 RepID=UPI00093DED6B|nr:hypothetical protein [Streptomyces sp. CB02009]OKJ60959.1 hypothetical protein AMK27_17320 [Streptomyces sp. CB02009]
MSPTRFASEHKWVYWGAIVILVSLVITGIVRYEAVKTNNETASKANQLRDQLVKAGYPAPDTETLERVLGTDGGPVCDDPGSALKTALWKIQQGNGATGPGMRPVITDSKAVEVERIVLQVYCPDEVDDFEDSLNDLKTDDTVRR